MSKIKSNPKSARATTVGKISAETLVFTAGNDAELDSRLLEAECIASAAHATMLAGLPVKPGIITPSEKKRLVSELVNMMRPSADMASILSCEKRQ